MVKSLACNAEDPGSVLRSWRRKWLPTPVFWLPTPVFWPGEFYGQRSLMGYSPWGHKESDMAEWLTLKFLWASQVAQWRRTCLLMQEAQKTMGSIHQLGISGGGNGYPLQYSCLENPMDRGAWQIAVHRVAQSWTWLKWLGVHGIPLSHAESFPGLEATLLFILLQACL